MSSPSGSTLSGLVSTAPHLLAYSIPLLLISILLTFAGTFLTLDRSRSFAPSYSPVPLPGGFDRPKKKLDITWLLRGGVGGLANGYIFGRMFLVDSQVSKAGIDRRLFQSTYLRS
jgi:hypothetical protein